MTSMKTYYEVPAPLSTTPAAAELNDFAKSAKLFQNTRYASKTITVNSIQRVVEPTSEHVAWKCELHVDNHILNMVCKFKIVAGKLCLLSKRHAENMRTCFDLVALYAKKVAALRVAEHVICEVKRATGTYYLWFEEFLPNFQKFLKYPTASSISLRLSVSSRRRIQWLQQKMLDDGKSPIFDAQGSIVEGCLVLSDIETAATLSRWDDIDADDCVRHIRQSSGRSSNHSHTGSSVSSWSKTIGVALIGILGFTFLGSAARR